MKKSIVVISVLAVSLIIVCVYMNCNKQSKQKEEFTVEGYDNDATCGLHLFKSDCNDDKDCYWTAKVCGKNVSIADCPAYQEQNGSCLKKQDIVKEVTGLERDEKTDEALGWIYVIVVFVGVVALVLAIGIPTGISIWKILKKLKSTPAAPAAPVGTGTGVTAV